MVAVVVVAMLFRDRVRVRGSFSLTSPPSSLTSSWQSSLLLPDLVSGSVSGVCLISVSRRSSKSVGEEIAVAVTVLGEEDKGEEEDEREEEEDEGEEKAAAAAEEEPNEGLLECSVEEEVAVSPPPPTADADVDVDAAATAEAEAEAGAEETRKLSRVEG